MKNIIENDWSVIYLVYIICILLNLRDSFFIEFYVYFIIVNIEFLLVNNIIIWNVFMCWVRLDVWDLEVVVDLFVIEKYNFVWIIFIFFVSYCYRCGKRVI